MATSSSVIALSIHFLILSQCCHLKPDFDCEKMLYFQLCLWDKLLCYTLFQATFTQFFFSHFQKGRTFLSCVGTICERCHLKACLWFISATFTFFKFVLWYKFVHLNVGKRNIFVHRQVIVEASVEAFYESFHF